MAADFIDSLRPLFDCLTDGFCIADADGRLLYANAAAGALLGPSASEAGMSSICNLLCEGLAGTCGETASGCPLKVARGPADAVTFKGNYSPTGRDLRVRCMRVRQPSIERHFLIIEDVSTQAEVGRHKEEWRQMLAHDFRNPLTIMHGVLHSIAEQGVGHALTHSDLVLLESGIRNSRRLDDLIESYLETSRLEDGAMPVHAAPVDVDLLIRELVTEEAADPRAHGSKLTTGPATKLTALADPDLLRRALANLIGNALKFTLPGGRIQVAASAGDRSVLISVTDDGPGISAQDLPHIFDRFYQGENNKKGHGLGLGLTFCRAASRAMGGDVIVDSEEGKGSVFTLKLPAAAAAEVSP